MARSVSRANANAQASSPGDGVGCIVRIQSMFDSFTPAERRVAEAVLAEPEALVLSSVSAIADRSNASEAAVSRFARRIGYRSFAEFKLSLSHDLISPTDEIYEDVELGDDAETAVAKVAAGNIRAIDDSVRAVDQRALAEAARRLASANRVAFFGLGGSAIAAQDAMHHFMRVLGSAFHVIDLHEQTIWAALSGPGDVLLLCSHSGTAREVVELATLASERGVFVIAITNHGPSPLSEVARLNLYTSTREGRFREDSLSSRIATLTLIDIIYVLVALQRPEQMAENTERIQAAIDAKRVVEKPAAAKRARAAHTSAANGR
jgi:RpiR family transcriptional regulator, carbohydrate utilization regulator